MPDAGARNPCAKIGPMAQLDLTPRPAAPTDPRAAAGPTAAFAARPTLKRSRSDRYVSGVAGGVARHLGVSALATRIAFVALSFAGGFGIVVYLLLWVLVPLEAPGAITAPWAGTAPGAATGTATGTAASLRASLGGGRLPPMPHLTTRDLVGGGLLVGGLVSLLVYSGIRFGGPVFIPVTLGAVGFAVLWARGSTDAEGRGTRLDLGSIGTPLEALVRARMSLPRLIAGAALIGGGMAVFLAATTSLEAAANVVLAVAVTAVGLVLLVGPWLWRLANELIEERTGRIRTEARAEMAAHLHDSVLQTLALIQRSKEPREMVTLARTQERDLRAWLYGRAPSRHGARLHDAIDAMAGRLELAHRVRIEAVVVGDAELDDDLRALVAATSEATTNAARHAGVEDVSVYVEVEDGQVEAFVRDGGTGFDPTAVPADRRGIADSILQRMERHGGSAEIRSEPGAGTEIHLRMPRRAVPAGVPA